jgi:hypothetical protein
MKYTVEIVFDDTVCALSAGLRQNWVDGESDTATINLSCGAGTGSPFMVFSITNKKTNKTRYAVADIRPLVNSLADKLKGESHAQK